MRWATPLRLPITFPAVTKGDQTLTGFQYSASSVAFGSAAPTVTAPGGVETTVSYSATPLTVCTVEPTSGALTLEGVGSCVITATAAGTDDYNEATADVHRHGAGHRHAVAEPRRDCR